MQPAAHTASYSGMNMGYYSTAPAMPPSLQPPIPVQAGNNVYYTSHPSTPISPPMYYSNTPQPQAYNNTVVYSNAMPMNSVQYASILSTHPPSAYDFIPDNSSYSTTTYYQNSFPSTQQPHQPPR